LSIWTPIFGSRLTKPFFSFFDLHIEVDINVVVGFSVGPEGCKLAGMKSISSSSGGGSPRLIVLPEWGASFGKFRRNTEAHSNTDPVSSADLINPHSATMRSADVAGTIGSELFCEAIEAERCTVHAGKIKRQWGAGAPKLFTASDITEAKPMTPDRTIGRNTDPEIEHDEAFSRDGGGIHPNRDRIQRVQPVGGATPECYSLHIDRLID
jgi:hypothetical protein